MRLKLDENFGRRGIDALSAAGHDVSTVAEQGMAGAQDRVLIDTCRHEGRCVVTLDLDFANPLLFRATDYSGIVVYGYRPTLHSKGSTASWRRW